MNLLTKLRALPKRYSALALVAVAVVAGSALVHAWGPSRDTYTVANPADHITFNSITDNPNVGDERNFVVVKDAANTASGGWQDDITVQPGKEYLVRVYVHNNAATSLNLTATNTRVLAALGTNTGTKVSLTGYVSADNARQQEVYDDASFNSTSTFNMAYVAGSAMIYNNATGTAGRAVSDNIVNPGGALIGYSANDGNLPGCFQYSSYVTFKVKPQFAQTADFTMDKQVRKHSSTTGGWVESYAAQPGETVDYIIRYKNTSQITMDNVVVKDVLPAGMTYVAGSTIMANSNYPDGKTISDNVTTATGVNIGSYGPGANAWVRFSATVAANGSLATCGANTLHNVATVETDYGIKTDGADVTVTKECVKHPAVAITKTVDDSTVNVNQLFTYSLTASNTGDVDLTNIVVTDTAPAGITFVSTDHGTIANNALSYTIPSLKVGANVTIKITAKAPLYKSGNIVNTACVNAPEVNPSNPAATDDCDDATVVIVEPNKVPVCNPATGTIITVPETDKDKYLPENSDKCKVKVCNPTTGEIIIVKEAEKGNYDPASSDKCAKITVCKLDTKSTTTIVKSNYDSTRYSTDMSKCTATPVTIVTELPKTGLTESVMSFIGAGSLVGAGAYYVRSRRG